MHPVGEEDCYHAHPHEAGALAALHVLSETTALEDLRIQATYGDCPAPPSCLMALAPLQHILELR